MLEERCTGEIEHSNWQRALLLWFTQNTALLAATEIRVAEGRYRVPDVAVFVQPPQGRIITVPPLAAIEILSPADTFQRLKARLRDYEAMGVHHLFVVESRTEVSRFKDGQFVAVGGSQSHLEGSGEALDWTAAAALLWPNPPPNLSAAAGKCFSRSRC